VVDVESAKGTRFGTERLQQSLYGQSGGAEDAIRAVLKQVDAFRGKIPLGDDLTMVAIQLQQTFATKHPHGTAEATVSQPASTTA
jgi:serine phosphatase RsbU (regulator of sigma subunit)